MNIADKISEQLNDLALLAGERAVQKIVEADVERISTAIAAVWPRWRKAIAAFERLGPDVVAHDETGKVLSRTWSRARLEEKAKARKAADRYEQAIAKALDGSDYNLVVTVANEREGGGGGSQKPDGETSA